MKPQTTGRFPWGSLKKKGDSFITKEKNISKGMRKYLSFYPRSRKGYTVTTKKLPDGRVQVWRNETI